MSKQRGPYQSSLLRQVRKAKGLTQQAVAERAGVHFTTIAKFERGERALSGDMLAAVAAALEVAPGELVEGAPKALPVRMVPVVRRLPTGAWTIPEDDVLGYIPGPSGGPSALAYQPSENEIDLVVRPGSTIVVDPDQFELRAGKVYVLKDAQGEITFSTFRSDPPQFESCSSMGNREPLVIGRTPFTVLARVVWQGSDL